MPVENDLELLKENTYRLYGQWFQLFDTHRDIHLRFNALYSVLLRNDLIKEEDYFNSCKYLLLNDLEQIGQHLQNKTNSEASKSKFHFPIFSRLKNFIVRVIFGTRSG